MTAFTDHIMCITVVTTFADEGTIEFIAEVLAIIGVTAYTLQNMYWILTITELKNSIMLLTNETTQAKTQKEERVLLVFFVVFLLCLLTYCLIELLTESEKLEGFVVTTILSCMFLAMIIIFLV